MSLELGMMAFRKADLDLRQYFKRACLSDSARKLPAGEADILEAFVGQVAYEFKVSIYGENVTQVVYPANWREAFKERWFPKWALKKWPVKFTTWKIDFVYPELEAREKYQPRISIICSDKDQVGVSIGRSWDLAARERRFPETGRW